MPRRKKSAAASSTSSQSLLAALPRELLQNIVDDAVGKHLRGIVAGAGDIGALYEGLTANSLWPLFQRLPVELLATGSSLFRPSKSPLVPTAKGRARKLKPVKEQIDRAAAPGKKSRASKKGHPATERRSSEEIKRLQEQVLAFIGQNPGLNAESIVQKMAGDGKAISDALARLRGGKKVSTTGERRGMVYAVA